MEDKLLSELITTVVKEGASDLHLAEGRVPVMRVDGYLIPMSKYQPITKESMDSMLSHMLSSESRQELETLKQTNFSFSHKEKERFRCNAYVALGKLTIAMRFVPTKVRTFEELNLPPILASFARRQQGFFLVVGPAGVGKSTTLATMIETINQERLEHVVTIEDPIEFIFEPKKSIIDQREIKVDAVDFHTALWSVFRQDADVVMIGEMREPETVSTAVTAAETGHLVLSTLHTNTASQTIDRIIDSFPADQQEQIRIQLSVSLLGVFSQRLVPRISGGLIPACELLINNNAVENLIREKRTHEIDTVIETMSSEGMIDMNRSLADLVRRGEITAENAFQYSPNQNALERLM